jgi:predicted acetyltransferase
MSITNEQISLVEPGAEFASEFLSMTAEYQQAGEDYYSFVSGDFVTYLRRIDEMARDIRLPHGIVPMTTFWLVKDGQTILGESKLRHRLTPALQIEGGHIGYIIRPSRRRKGYGTLILSLTLEKARVLGLERVLVTCDTDNIGSARIIEKNGGVLAGRAVSHRSGKFVSQYWIEL